MTKFEDVALRAVLGQLPPETSRADFTNWDKVSALLARLTPEQRCDSVYAEWLHQLQSSSGQILLSVRNDLISHGALAANYLAELAQNADDASDGKPAEVRIVFTGEWLLVANNGRKITPKNLLGLCRFFVHFGREAVQLDKETIGRFGIGFKSSYRIASEVFVETWERGVERFAFRLPICHPDRPESQPEPTRLAWIREHLRGAGSDISEETCRVEHLGLCTPEFVEELPDAIREQAKNLQAPERGTVFCFHLHEEGRQEVAGRITGEASEVYELCPLFLPNLFLVQRGQAELSRQLKDPDANDSIPGTVEARRVVLTTRLPGQRRANSCFWRLRGLADGDKWQIAVHTDSQFRLSVARVSGEEEETSVKDGAAYAFFPLNAVNAAWPLRLHLHLDLPTELSRRDWNHERATDRDAVEAQIRRAIAGLAAWLERHPDKRHDDWRLEDLVERVPERNELWACAVWDALLHETKSRRVLRVLDGSFAAAEGEARTVSVALLDKEEARRAWAALFAARRGPPVVEMRPGISFGVPKLTSDELAELLANWMDWSNSPAEFRQSLLHATLACADATASMVESVLGDLTVELASGGTASIVELFRQPGGSELTSDWHTTFRRLASWTAIAPWREASVFGSKLESQLRKLADPEFNPTWAEVPRRMANEAAWRELGEKFWQSKRLSCPEVLGNSVLSCLRGPAASGQWLLLTEAWLLSDGVPDLLKSLFVPISGGRREHIRSRLREWQLLDAWMETAELRVRKELPGRLLSQLTEQASGDAIGLTFNHAFDELRQQPLGRLREEVNEAAKLASSRFVRSRADEDGLKDRTVVTADVAAPVRAALCLLPEMKAAPPWLTTSARRRLESFGVIPSFRILDAKELKERQSHLARHLLDHFHQWSASAPTPEALAGLEAMAASESRLNRRNWPVGLSAQKKPLLKELVHAQPPNASASPVEQLKLLLLAKVERRKADLLPEVLAQVPSLAEACVQPHKLELEVPNVTLTSIERGQIPPAALGEAAVRALVDAGEHALFTTSQPLKLRWRQDDEVVATLPAADFVVDGDKLIFADSLPPAGQEQFREVLALYQRSDNPSAEYQRDKESGASPFALYRDHRARITKVLLEKEVQAMGYGREHVLRELLQNAESAYASKASPPAEPWFQFIVERPAQGSVCQVSISHVGRAFNEPDKDGRERPDVERIVKINAPTQNTEDEIGRFNRGFKSVFCVALDQRVHIRSGGYDFHVQDLLLRHPDPPVRTLGDQDPVTRFTFRAQFADARAMLGHTEALKANFPLPVLNASSFVFLRYMRRVTVKFEGREWTWRISRQPEADGWERVTVDACNNRAPEVFLVFRGRQENSTGRSFSAALRLNQEGLPTKLDEDWRTLRLTFETDERFNLDVLINGQFDAEPGRRKLVKVAESGLVDAAFNAVVTRCELELTRENSKRRWLAWARVINLSDGVKALKDKARSFETISRRVEQFLTTHVPHGNGSRPVGQLVFPTGLMRELLKANFAGRWGIPSGDWIDAEVEKELPAVERQKFSLDDWLSREIPLTPKLKSLRADLDTAQFEKLSKRFSQPQKDEFAKAQRILAEKLRPVAPILPTETPPDPREEWSVADLWHWWGRQGRPVDDYILEGGDNWPLWGLSPDSSEPGQPKNALAIALDVKADPDSTVRSTVIRDTLLAINDDEGKGLWYRVMSFACLMSAGRRMSELRAFWTRDLEERGFWQATSGKEFGDGTDALFDELLRRRFADFTASGEGAHFWRRVFYDLRKIHRLVWKDEFPTVLLELAQSRERGVELLNFLRSGQLSGQQAWEGVFGQSAGVPLFFLVRELRRLRVIENQQLDPLAFFACAPVRRAAWRLCWLDDDMVRRTDFGSLANVSEMLHRKIASDRAHGSKLLVDYDIPLLHYGLTQ
ncbi:MAG: ATP-binding protein [Verrucomicrobia bacterium]|nr:ATP-binding protein [Verrucomicrobiota bacterium]